MILVLLGVSSALGYGFSDYFAGPASRLFSPALLVLFSQIAQAVIILGVLAVGVRSLELDSLAWGAAAGVLNAVALIAYYEALGRGKISIVAPIASTGAAVPVIVTVFRGAMAPLRPPRSDDRPDRASLILSLVAAGAFGAYFLLVDGGTAGSDPATTFWIAEGVQLGALSTTAGVILVRRSGWALPRGSVPRSLALITALNLIADMALVAGMGRGSVAVVGVLTSLAPVVTVALALVLREERPSRQQGLGAGLAVFGTIVIAATQ